MVKKKLAALLLSFALALSAVYTVSAEAKAIGVSVEGQELAFGAQEPLFEAGRTFVPAVPLFEALELDYAWDADNKTATGTKDGYEIVLQVGSTQATINGEPVEFGNAPMSIADVTYVPVRAVAESAGYEVRWDAETRSVAIVAVQAAASEPSRGFLWKAEKDDTTVYLVGSIHFADESMYPLRAELQAAYDDAEYLAVEADTLNISQEEMEKLVLEYGVYTDGTTLKDHIAADTYAKLGQLLEAIGAPADALDMFEPWYVSLTLSSLQMMSGGLDTTGIDMHFLMQATEDNKPIIELESNEFQLEMFDGFSLELQEELVVQTLDGILGLAEESDMTPMALSEMWKTGDEEALDIILQSFTFNDEYYKAMMEDRNVAMVEKIEAFLASEEDEDYLVVVGAAHMIGEHGVVTLLEANGYTVTRI